MADSTISFGSVNITAKNPSGATTLLPVSGNAAKTTSSLPSNGTWTTGWLDTSLYGGAETTIYSDVDGSYVLSYSDDNGTTLSLPAITVQYSTSQGTRKGQFPLSATFIKFDYTNGSTAQTKFRFQVSLLTQPAQSSAETISASGSNTRTAAWNKSIIETYETGGTTFDKVTRTGNSLNVYQTGGVAPTGASTSALQITGNTALGTPGDTMVTDATASGSVIALLKGLLQESVAQASTASFTAYTLAANAVTTIAASGNGKGRIISSVSGTILVGVGFVATASNWSYRIVTNGTIEIRPEWGALSISLFSTAAGVVNVTVMS